MCLWPSWNDPGSEYNVGL